MQDKLEEIEYSVIAATFHVNGKVNRHNVCIWDEENLHAIVELERDSPEVNMFRVISMKPLHDPLFFLGKCNRCCLFANASEMANG